MVKDLTNMEINNLKVISFIGTNKKHRAVWKCLCNCGNEFTAVGSEIIRGKVKSCGCLNKSINGLYKSRIYRIHHSMMSRCYVQNIESYKYYGKRGIKVCDEWHDFMNFYNWSINNGYSDDLTIDRINVNGNYEPSNCRWVTRKEQANNTSSNVYIYYNGETKTLSQWAEKVGIDRRTLYKRFSMGWNIEKALTTPVNKNFSRKKIKDIETRQEE